MGDVSTLELVGRLLVSLGVVLALMLGAAAVLRRRGGFLGAARIGRRPLPVEVLARQALGRNASVVVIRTAGKALVVGVTEQSVRLLAEVDADGLEIDDTEGHGTALPGGDRPRPAGMALLDALRERTVRRT